MRYRPETWESVWKDRTVHNGFIHRVGRTLAEYGDLQRIVLGRLKKTGKIGEKTKILEVGCGSGPVLRRLSRITGDVCGVDISPAAVRLTIKKGVGAAVADALELPFEDGSFNLVYSTGVVDLFDDTDAAVILKEMVRITVPGGRIVIITAWIGCRLHEAVKKYLIRRNRWGYGPKRTFSTLEPLLSTKEIRIKEQKMGALFQFRFISYLFEEHGLVRRMYHGFYLLFSILLWPLNRLPGALLVTTVEKK